MIINSIKKQSFCSKNPQKQNSNKFLYPILQVAGSTCGYLIPLKHIEVDEIVPSREGLTMKQKKLKPNIIGKYKNALIGAFIGTTIALIINIVKNNKHTSSK